MSRHHYLTTIQNALAEGFEGLAAALWELYKKEFGEENK